VTVEPIADCVLDYSSEHGLVFSMYCFTLLADLGHSSFGSYRFSGARFKGFQGQKRP